MNTSICAVFALLLLLCVVSAEERFNTIKESSSVLWPKPTDLTQYGDNQLRIFPYKFTVNLKSRNPVLERSIQEYLPYFFPFPFENENTDSEISVRKINIR